MIMRGKTWRSPVDQNNSAHMASSVDSTLRQSARCRPVRGPIVCPSVLVRRCVGSDVARHMRLGCAVVVLPSAGARNSQTFEAMLEYAGGERRLAFCGRVSQGQPFLPSPWSGHGRQRSRSSEGRRCERSDLAALPSCGPSDLPLVSNHRHGGCVLQNAVRRFGILLSLRRDGARPDPHAHRVRRRRRLALRRERVNMAYALAVRRKDTLIVACVAIAVLSFGAADKDMWSGCR